MSRTQADRIARVEARKLPDRPAPWMAPIAGTRNWVLLDDISVLALAEGIVLARVQQQARQCARTIDSEAAL